MGVMDGVRVVEVAEHTFVPAAGAILATWGADVIKVEPVERGDAARGLTAVRDGIVPIFEHSNRAKRSLALDLAHPDGRAVLDRLLRRTDVFMTNKVGRVRRKLGIDADDLRAVNPSLIYVRGTGWGEQGEEADRGGYDLLGFWHRSGASMGVARDGEAPFLPGPGFGDSIGALAIAGGVMGALYHRERTGEATTVDVSLLGTGMWAMGAAIAQAAIDPNWTWPPATRNPLSANYRTKDHRWFALCCLQAAHYWPLVCATIGRPDLATDPRFADHPSIMANSDDAQSLLRDTFATRTLAEWRTQFHDFPGQWSWVDDVANAANDAQARENHVIDDHVTANGTAFPLVAPPVQFDAPRAPAARSPAFNEHGDDILTEIGLDWDTVVDLKLRGITA